MGRDVGGKVKKESEQGTRKINNMYFPLTCSDVYLSRLFWCELLSFGDSCSRDVCHLLNIVELGSIWLVVLKAPKHRNVCFLIIMTWLLKVIHRHSQEFHVGTAVLSCRVSMLID